MSGGPSELAPNETPPPPIRPPYFNGSFPFSLQGTMTDLLNADVVASVTDQRKIHGQLEIRPLAVGSEVI
jgi:hypothetical protein